VIPSGVQVFVALEPIDMRCYAEPIVMRSLSMRLTTAPVRLSEAGLLCSA
jgi:hypothetical protein